MNMKVKTLALAAGTATSLLLAGTASANVVGIEVHHWNDNLIDQYGGEGVGGFADFLNASGAQVYRIFAVFDTDDIDLQLVGGQGDNPAWMSVNDGTFVKTGGNRGNHDDAFFTTPGLPPTFYEPGWNTYATIGAFANDDNTSFAPDSDAAVNWTGNFGANTDYWDSWNPDMNAHLNWFIAGNPPQGVPQASIDGIEDDGLYRVGIFQATLDNADATFEGNFGIMGGNGFDVTSGEILGFSTKAPDTPAPGALALLGLAGLVGTRRRRA